MKLRGLKSRIRQSTGKLHPACFIGLPRKLIVVLVGGFLFASICFSTAYAQNDSNSRIDRLRGGFVGIDLKWSGELFSGLGARADAKGGSISTLDPDAETMSSNPAGLGFARGFSMTFDWAPPLTIDPGGLLGIENQINESLMETAENNSPGGIVPPNTVQDATVNTSLDMRGGLKGGAVLYSTPEIAIGGAFHQPFRLESQFNMSGTEFLAVALDDDGKETNRIFGTINGNFNIAMELFSSSVALSRQFGDRFALGLAYDNLNGEMNFEGTFLPEGIIASAGGETRPFNDPAQIQYDSLFAVVRGDWEGNGFRLRGGMSFHPNENVSLDLAFNSPFSITMSGPFTMVHNSIRALNLGAEGDEEVLDVDILLEDNLTKTKKIVTHVDGMKLELPGSLALGFATRWANYQASFTMRGYFGELGYEFAYQQFDSLGAMTKRGNIQQGARFGLAVRAGIGVEPLTLGLGMVLGETFKETTTIDIEEGETDAEPDVSEGSTIFVPFFSLGGGIRFSQYFRIDYVASITSSAFFRLSTTINL